jgi:Ca2+-binding RTX toxin-like protein
MQHRDSHPSDSACQAIERLEPRTLLAAELPADGILRVTGTRKADTIFVTYGPDALDTIFVRINKDTFSFRTDEVNGIRVQAGALGDHVEFRAFATNPDHFDKPTTIYGSTGGDFIIGPGSPTRIYGGTGDDKINGGFDRDVIYGEEGNDTLDGGQGSDFLRGGLDNDRITGGLGIDKMFGDEGRDTLLSRGDLPLTQDTRPFEPVPTFDLVDGGAGRDRADVDDLDHRISIEERFTQL